MYLLIFILIDAAIPRSTIIDQLPTVFSLRQGAPVTRLQRIVSSMFTLLLFVLSLYVLHVIIH